MTSDFHGDHNGNFKGSFFTVLLEDYGFKKDVEIVFSQSCLSELVYFGRGYTRTVIGQSFISSGPNNNGITYIFIALDISKN